MPTLSFAVQQLADALYVHRFFWMLWLSDRKPQRSEAVQILPFELLSLDGLTDKPMHKVLGTQAYQLCALLYDPKSPIEVHLRPVLPWDDCLAQQLLVALQSKETLIHLLSTRLPEQLIPSFSLVTTMEENIVTWERHPHLSNTYTAMAAMLKTTLKEMQSTLQHPDFSKRMLIEQIQFAELFSNAHKRACALLMHIKNILAMYKDYPTPQSWTKCFVCANDTIAQCQVVRSILALWSLVLSEQTEITRSISAFAKLYPYSLWHRLMLALESLLVAVRRLWTGGTGENLEKTFFSDDIQFAMLSIQ